MQAFHKAYGKILDLTIAEISTEAIVSLTQYYDQPLRCFTFRDFQLVPIVEEFEEILGCPLGGRKSYLFSGVSSLLEQDCSCGQGFGDRSGSCKANSKRRSGPTTKVLRRQGKGYGESSGVGPIYGHISIANLWGCPLSKH